MKKRLIEFLSYLGIGQLKFEENVGLSRGYVNKIGDNITVKSLDKISSIYPELNINWLKTGEGDMIISKKEQQAAPIKTGVETRPRIPLNAAAGSLAVAMDGVSSNDCELMPVVAAFQKYSYTILVKGDSMNPQFQSGDELACLQLRAGTFIQWGNYHVLDTEQGIIVKRIYEDGDYIVCKSDNQELYKDFKILKTEIYNIGKVIGMLRRF